MLVLKKSDRWCWLKLHKKSTKGAGVVLFQKLTNATFIEIQLLITIQISVNLALDYLILTTKLLILHWFHILK